MANPVPTATEMTTPPSAPVAAPLTAKTRLPFGTPEARVRLAKIALGLAGISLLATLVSLTLNPYQRDLVADNTLRQQHLTELRQALTNYAAAHGGTYPSTQGEYWCENCTYPDFQAKGSDQWIPDLVAQGYMSSLPTDPANLIGTTCRPNVEASFAGYVYYSPPAPANTEFKLFAQCTPPAFALNQGSQAPQQPYCSTRPPYGSDNLTANPFRDVALKPFVDPVRYEYAYAIYTPGLACL